jgi:hypothetical protein
MRRFWLAYPEPNKGLELTASSVRSSLASASGSSSGLALGVTSRPRNLALVAFTFRRVVFEHYFEGSYE